MSAYDLLIRTVMLLIAWLWNAGILNGAPDQPPPTTNETQAAPGPVDPAAHDAEKQRQAFAALLALCGILILGLAFLVVVIVWGGRLRRLARAELPAQKTLEDDLWFLKPPKSPPE